MCCDKISMNFTNARKAQPVIIYEDSVGTTQVTNHSSHLHQKKPRMTATRWSEYIKEYNRMFFCLSLYHNFKKSLYEKKVIIQNDKNHEKKLNGHLMSHKPIL